MLTQRPAGQTRTELLAAALALACVIVPGIGNRLKAVQRRARGERGQVAADQGRQFLLAPGLPDPLKQVRGLCRQPGQVFSLCRQSLRV